MEYFLKLFGELNIGWAVVGVGAAVFLRACYKRVESYFSEKAVADEEKDKQIQEVIDQAKQYPVWREQSVEAQRKIYDKFEIMNQKIDSINDSMKNLNKENEETKALTWRYRILRFGDEVCHDEKHTKEHFDQILEDITNYENYCRDHPKFPNNKAVLAIANIKDAYQRCAKEGTFL